MLKAGRRDCRQYSQTRGEGLRPFSHRKERMKMNCPICNRELSLMDYRDIYDSETGSYEQYINCPCGYLEYEEQGERELEELFI